MKFLREISNKTKDRIRNTKIRSELWVDEMKNDIEKSILRSVEKTKNSIKKEF